jgi:hypothetical protein
MTALIKIYVPEEARKTKQKSVGKGGAGLSVLLMILFTEIAAVFLVICLIGTFFFTCFLRVSCNLLYCNMYARLFDVGYDDFIF